MRCLGKHSQAAEIAAIQEMHSRAGLSPLPGPFLRGAESKSADDRTHGRKWTNCRKRYGSRLGDTR
jgi:hypothetical protein